MIVHHHKISAIRTNLLDWFSVNARDLPWRRTRDPYAIWVSEIMLQQTQVKTVIPFWERWLRELPTIEAAANASSDQLHKLWEGLGYYTRVRNFQKAAQVIVQQHGGKFPERFEEVLALPGIGRYTAGAICSIAFNQPTAILDGNVVRVLTRVFGIAENPKDKETNARLWELATELVLGASGFAAIRGDKARLAHSESESRTRTRTRTKGENDACSRLNQSLMELGALVCTPRNPQCLLCPVQHLCVAFRDGRVDVLPNLGERAPATARRFAAFVVERDGKFLVRQRPAGVVNAHLWEFPNVEVGASPGRPPGDSLGAVGRSTLLRVTAPSSRAVSDAAKGLLGFAAQNLSPLVTVKHSITRYRITLEAFTVNLGRTHVAPDGAVWKTPAQMQQLAFTSAHRKILRAIERAKT
jgi:A/G-specific adenine glycosylase